MDKPNLVKGRAPFYYATDIECDFVKIHPDAVLPCQNNSELGIGDTGYDLTAIATVNIPAHGSALIPTGLRLAYITRGYWFRVEGRSGLGFKHSVQPHFGIIDNPYRGDLGVKLYNLSDTDKLISKGDRLAQIIFYPLIQPKVGWRDEVVPSNRGEKGFGASGN